MGIVSVPCIALIVAQWVTEPPLELRALESGRSLHKAHVDWSSIRFDKGEHSVRYTSRYAGSDQMITNRGDEDGVVFRDAEARPKPWPGKVHHVLLRDGLRWNSDGECFNAYVDEVSGNLQLSIDVRAIGLSPDHRAQQDVHSTLWASSLEKIGPVQYRVDDEDGLRVVRARASVGNTVREAVWWLDPARDFLPVRTQLLGDRDEVIRESRSSLVKFGDVWFPESVALFQASYKDGTQPYEIVTIDTASFHESLPARLAPEDIGVQVGTNVNSQLVDSPGLLGWDGEKLVEYGDLVRRIRTGELQYGDGYLRASDRVMMENTAKTEAGLWKRGQDGQPPQTPSFLGLEYADRTPGLWEDYVKRFIAKYNLDSAQREQAFRILRDCQGQAEGYFSRRAGEFAELDDEERRIKNEHPGVEEGAADLAEVFKKRVRLQGPIIRIFEAQLVPRLDKLPTREQRRAAREQEGAKGKDKAEARKGG